GHRHGDPPFDGAREGHLLRRAGRGHRAGPALGLPPHTRRAGPGTRRAGPEDRARDRDGGRDRRRGQHRHRVRRHARRVRENRSHHGEAADPAATSRRRGRPAFRRVLRPRGRHRLRGHPAGPRPAGRACRPRQAGGTATDRRTSAGRALRPRHPDQGTRGQRPQGDAWPPGDAVSLTPEPGQEAVRAGDPGDRRRCGGDLRDRSGGRAPHQDRGALHSHRGERQGLVHRSDGPARTQHHARAARREDRHRRLGRRPGAAGRECVVARSGLERLGRRRREPLRSCRGARLPALTRHRQGGPERAAGGAVDRLAHRHPLRRGAGPDSVLAARDRSRRGHRPAGREL
ncbi:MAG: Transcription termination protein NusA, partial [uncultured Nocardioidaceae bacterium]